MMYLSTYFITTTPLLCHHNAPLVLFALASLPMRLDLQIQAPIISSSSSEKFEAMIDRRREGDLGAAAQFTSDCKLCVSISISPPPPPVIALATTTRASLYAPCLRQSPLLTAPLAHPSLLQCFFIAPCVKQTPPLRDCFTHPS